MFDWVLIFKHEERMKELEIERLKLEVEKLRLEAEHDRSRQQKNQYTVPKGFDLSLHPRSISPYRRSKRWDRR